MHWLTSWPVGEGVYQIGGSLDVCNGSQLSLFKNLTPLDHISGTCEKTHIIKWKFNFRDNRRETYVFGWANSSFPIIWCTKRVIIAKKYTYIVVFKHFFCGKSLFLWKCALWDPPWLRPNIENGSKPLWFSESAPKKCSESKLYRQFLIYSPPSHSWLKDK